MKKIGLLGGMSWESTELYYRLINEGVKNELGGLHSAELLLYSVDFQVIEALQHQGDWASCEDRLAEAASALAKAGAETLLICTNTMHKVAEGVSKRSGLPILHIADATADVIKKQGYKNIALLGTAFTMSEAFYKDRLIEKHGLSVMVPSPDDQKIVHDIIYQELCLGKINDTSRQHYLQIMDELYQEGAEAIILGCTEITLLVKPEHTQIPLLDTTAIHAAAAVQHIVG